MTVVPSDPAADVRDAIAARSGVPELDEKIWFHRTAAAVIEPGRCVGCAGCVAACPSGSIAIADDRRPTLVRMCTGCSSCWDFCPLAGLRTERLHALDLGGGQEPAEGLGSVRAAYTASARERAPSAQDGGVATAMLAALLELRLLDGALLSRRLDAFRGESALVTSPAEVSACAGSVYDQSLPLALLTDPLPERLRRLALVGTPCQVTALRALQRFPWGRRPAATDKVELTIALFCTRSFDPVRLRSLLRGRGVDPRQVARIDVRDGALLAEDAEGVPLIREPVGELATAGLPGCDECADFAGASADIAVGSRGSPNGHTTVLVRTAAGEAAWEAVRDVLDWAPLDDLEPVARAARRNRRRALRHLRRDWAPEGPIWVGYREHLDAYADTDRTSIAPPPHRSQHYQVSC